MALVEAAAGAGPQETPQEPKPKHPGLTHAAGTVTVITTTSSGNVTPFYLTAWANSNAEKWEDVYLSCYKTLGEFS